ncbi:Uncharacterised protein [Escherichia coli]|uniref:Uncharacterized protein n=1 Tax=Escherichia coli TaxID=562 RepID=A0A376K8J3_ECOLX|nr:Uncharacterised protein [Escherichia coli]
MRITEGCTHQFTGSSLTRCFVLSRRVSRDEVPSPKVISLWLPRRKPARTCCALPMPELHITGVILAVIQGSPCQVYCSCGLQHQVVSDTEGRPVSSEPSQPQPRARKSLLSDDAFMLWRVSLGHNVSPQAGGRGVSDSGIRPGCRHHPGPVPAREPSSSLTSTEEWPAAPYTPAVTDIPATSVLIRSPSRRTNP